MQDKLLPASTLARLVPAVEARVALILADVQEQFQADWPDYARFLAVERDEVSAAAHAFLAQLVDRTGGDPAAAESGPQSALFEEIGRVQWREGRDLRTLLSAYQVGARVAWRHVSAAALEIGAEPDVLAALAEGVFIFVDQLSSASARGYVDEQTEHSAAREVSRDELVELLLSGRADEVALRRAAIRAGWTPPAEAAVILFDPDNEIGQQMLGRMEASSLTIRRRAVTGAIVSDPRGPGRRARLCAALRGAGAVIGPAVPLANLPASFHIADIAVGLMRDGVLDEDPVVADEHFDAIIVHRDARLLAVFRAQVLAPLDGLAPAGRDRLVETLTSWLRHFGDRQAVAAELHVHPQTVRYRMAQLHRLLGDALDEPAGRARFMLALGWQRPRR